MAKCSSCAAPLKPNNPICGYCGSRNNIDLNSINYNTGHMPDEDRVCPTCNIKMQTVDISGDKKDHFYIERCEECHGLFFDNGEIEALLQEKTSNVFNVNHDLLNELLKHKKFDTKFSYRNCPICSKIMNRNNYGAKSGIVVDVCKNHGVYLDSGELNSLMEWKKAGGKILDEKRQALKDEDEKRVERKKKQQQTTEEYYTYSSDNSRGRMRSGDVVIDGLVNGLVKLFGR